MIKDSYKFIIITVLALLAVLVVGFLTFQYIYGSSKVKQVVEHKTEIKTAVPPIDLAQLEADYQAKSTEILTNYLAQADPKNVDLATTTEQAQTDLLNLSLPPQYRERHLAEVLLLGEITVLAKTGKTVAVEKKISELKDFVAKK